MINILAIVLCAVWAMVVGFVWYSRSVIGNEWMRLSDLDMKKLTAAQKNMGRTYGSMILLNVITAIILSAFLSVSSDLGMNMLIILIAWFVFTFGPFATANSFSLRSFKLTLINSGYNLISFLGMAVILTLLRG